MHLAKPSRRAQLAESLPLMWETQNEYLLYPGCILAVGEHPVSEQSLYLVYFKQTDNVGFYLNLLYSVSVIDPILAILTRISAG